jgi:hypothetical protein
MTANDPYSDTREQPERTLVLNIDLSRGLVAALLIVAVIAAAALLTRGPAPASAAGEAVSAATDNMRSYYLGTAVLDATYAIGGCEAGYHFASLWEILDPSNLVYNTTLGTPTTDSGYGPPGIWEGWVRTGYSANSGTTPGQANCDAWTTTAVDTYGTTVRLPTNWIAGSDLHVWVVGTASCGSPAKIWCVED